MVSNQRRAGSCVLAWVSVLLMISSGAAESVDREVSGGFSAKEETPTEPFDPVAGEIDDVEVQGQLPPVNEKLSIESGGVRDKTADEDPVGEEPSWWDGELESISTIGGGNRTVNDSYFTDLNVTGIRLDTFANGGHIEWVHDADAFYPRDTTATFRWVTVSTESNRTYSKDCNGPSDDDITIVSNLFPTIIDNPGDYGRCSLSFGRTERISNITFNMTSQRGGSAGIADVSLVVPGGYYKPTPELSGDYTNGDDWTAFRPKGRTFLPNISVANGSFNIYKDEVLYCTGENRPGDGQADLVADDVGVKNVDEHGDFCLKDWREGSSGGLPTRTADDVLEDNKTSSAPKSQVSEEGPEFKESINPDEPETFSLVDMTATGDIQVRDKYNVSEERPVQKPPLIDYNGSITESIVVESTLGGDEYTNGTIETFELMSLFPTGNTWIKKGDGEFFGGEQNTATSRAEVSGFYDGSEGWVDAKELSLGLKNHERVEVQADLVQGAPDTRSLENYRLYHQESGTTLTSFTQVEEDGTGYVQRSKVVDTQESPVPSGQWTFQMKADAGSRNVELGVKNLVVETDEDIVWNTTETFAPQLTVGNNQLQVNTEKEGVLNYTLQWTECRDPVRSPRPTGGRVLGVSLGNGLSLETRCDRDLRVRFYDADSQALLGEDRTRGTGETASSGPLNLRSGSRLNWYAKVCDVDQDACHRTATHSFSIGSPNRGLSNAETRAIPGFREVIRDEDFNQTGQSISNRPSSRAYVNKIEDDSDQLEYGPKWNNSNGSEKNADQYALTPSPAWTISNRGKPYPPPSDSGDYRATFYRYPSDPGRRTEISDPSIPKRDKVFGNSLGVVAAEDVRRDIDGDGGKELVAREGTGVWIDPDEVEKTRNGEYEYTGPGSWRQKFLSFNMDVTGPDSGLGYDRDSPGPIIYREDRKTIISDIHWQREP